jgi:Ca2+/H+ antiporter, TMEM165/GDT1 family
VEAFLVSTGVVVLAEMGDKTQLLALVLAVRFRRPLPIIAGIFVATIVNHTIAGAVGTWITATVGPQVLRWVLGASFIGMAIWALIPDRLDGQDSRGERLGVFGATVLAFFLAEMGDKTQIATVALAAKYSTFYSVVAGTTFGMMLADVPAVLLGDRVTKIVPVRVIRVAAAVVFLMLGGMALLNVGRLL